jgi:hypothetical protein
MADSDFSLSLWIFLGIGPKYFFGLKDQHWVLGFGSKKQKNFFFSCLTLSNSMGYLDSGHALLNSYAIAHALHAGKQSGGKKKLWWATTKKNVFSLMIFFFFLLSVFSLSFLLVLFFSSWFDNEELIFTAPSFGQLFYTEDGGFGAMVCISSICGYCTGSRRGYMQSNTTSSIPTFTTARGLCWGLALYAASGHSGVAYPMSYRMLSGEVVLSGSDFSPKMIGSETDARCR